MKRRFTGRHMTVIIVGFFAVVVVVNIVMATLAVRTFGGTVVDNSYVASQGYNSWLAKAKKQEELGWRAEISRTAPGHVHVSAHIPPGMSADVRVTGSAIRPLGDTPEVALDFRPDGGGFRSTRPLPDGRWLVRVTIAGPQGETARFTQELGG